MVPIHQETCGVQSIEAPSVARATKECQERVRTWYFFNGMDDSLQTVLRANKWPDIGLMGCCSANGPSHAPLSHIASSPHVGFLPVLKIPIR